MTRSIDRGFLSCRSATLQQQSRQSYLQRLFFFRSSSGEWKMISAAVASFKRRRQIIAIRSSFLPTDRQLEKIPADLLWTIIQTPVHSEDQWSLSLRVAKEVNDECAVFSGGGFVDNSQSHGRIHVGAIVAYRVRVAQLSSNIHPELVGWLLWTINDRIITIWYSHGAA